MAISIAAYLIALNAPAPWDGIRLIPKSTLELVVGAALAAIAAATSVCRLLSGSTPDSELK